MGPSEVPGSPHLIIVHKLVPAPYQRLLALKGLHVLTSCPPLDRLSGQCRVGVGLGETSMLLSFLLIPSLFSELARIRGGVPGLL